MSFGKVLKRGATAIATGGNSEWGAGGQLFGGGGTTTQSQVPLETPEQRAAREMLLKYAQTGQFSGTTAGADIGIHGGNYDLSGLEQSGLSHLNSLISSGQPEMYGAANDSIRSLMDTSTAGLDSMFSPYKAIADREGQVATDAAKRGSAFTGNLFSTDAVRRIGDVAAKTNESKLGTLAGLTNDALNRKVSATGLAQTAGSLQESTNRNRIADSITYGGLQRTLQNQQVEEQNAEKLRRRNEIMGQLDAAKSVAGAQAQFGVPSVEVAKPNPYMDFLQLLVGGGSRLAGMAGTGSAGASGASTMPRGYAPWTPTGNPLSLY